LSSVSIPTEKTGDAENQEYWYVTDYFSISRMLKKAVLAFFNHEPAEMNSAGSHNFNELTLVKIGAPSMGR